jgi:hypothetical protein
MKRKWKLPITDNKSDVTTITTNARGTRIFPCSIASPYHYPYHHPQTKGFGSPVLRGPCSNGFGPLTHTTLTKLHMVTVDPYGL